jgi:hypothetical protein
VKPLSVATLEGSTIYGRVGELWSWVMLVALAGVVWLGGRVRRPADAA